MRRLVVLTLLLPLLEGCVTTSTDAEKSAVTITTNPNSVAGCKSLGSFPSWMDTVHHETVILGGNTALINGYGAHNIAEAYLCPDSLRPAPSLPADCRWEIGVGAEWHLPEAQWCGNITITKLQAKATESAVKGTIWIKNRSKTGNELTVTISAVEGDKVLGTTRWEHGIGDDTTDTKRFSIDSEAGRTATHLVVAILSRK